MLQGKEGALQSKPVLLMCKVRRWAPFGPTAANPEKVEKGKKERKRKKKKKTGKPVALHGMAKVSQWQTKYHSCCLVSLREASPFLVRLGPSPAWARVSLFPFRLLVDAQKQCQPALLCPLILVSASTVFGRLHRLVSKTNSFGTQATSVRGTCKASRLLYRQ